MSKPKNTLGKVLGAHADNNIPFRDMVGMLESLGFQFRIKGSHHSFKHPRIPERIVLQPKNAKCKAYQVKQVRELILEYGTELDIEEDTSDGKDESEEENAKE